MNQTLKLVAHLDIQAEQIAHALPIFKKMVELTRQETGCLSYVLLQNTADVTKFTFVEEWADKQALAQHFEMEHMVESLKKLTPLLSGKPDIQTYFEV